MRPTTLFSLLRGCLFGGFFLLPIPGNTRADVPVPQRMLNPGTAAEAWNVIRLATANTERLFEEGRSDEVKDQIALLSPALRVLSQHGMSLEDQKLIDENTAKAFSQTNLIVKESMAGNGAGARQIFAMLQQSLKSLEAVFAPDLVKAEIYTCVEHPETAVEAEGQVCSLCQKPLRARRLPYSFIYVKPGKHEMQLAARADAPLQAGREAVVELELANVSGAPMTAEDLLISHTAPVHWLLVDETLQDFHHLAPKPGGAPGAFTAEFKPALDGPYRAWAGVVPSTSNLQEYLPAQLPGLKAAPGALEKKAASSVTADGFKFQMLFQGIGTVKVGVTNMMRVEVTEGDGQPVTRLEPFFAAFAHATAVYEDLETVVQLHSVGGDILLDDLRGGPHLAFKFHPPKAGFVRMFCQVKIDGRLITAPFGLTVVE